MATAQVLLLDGKLLELQVDRKAKAEELFDKVCAHLDLVEKEYFGLVLEERNGEPRNWIELDKKIGKFLKSTPCKLNFEVKFYPPDPTHLQEDITRYLLCLQVRNNVLSGKLPCSFVTHAMLGSYLVQSELGDWNAEEHGDVSYLKGFTFAPDQTPELVTKVMELHKTHKGQTPAEAELHYLENAKKLATYGVDFHPAKDADGVDIILGVCATGLLVYRERLRISRFPWPKIIKIAFRRHHFFVKIRPGDFEQVESTIGFKCPSHRAAKRLWKTSVEHHTFFRLMSPDAVTKPGIIPKLSSGFSYRQKTHYQTKQREINREPPKFARTLSTHLPSRSMDPLTQQKEVNKEANKRHTMPHPPSRVPGLDSPPSKADKKLPGGVQVLPTDRKPSKEKKNRKNGPNNVDSDEEKENRKIRTDDSTPEKKTKKTSGGFFSKSPKSPKKGDAGGVTVEYEYEVEDGDKKGGKRRSGGFSYENKSKTADDQPQSETVKKEKDEKKTALAFNYSPGRDGLSGLFKKKGKIKVAELDTSGSEGGRQKGTDGKKKKGDSSGRINVKGDVKLGSIDDAKVNLGEEIAGREVVVGSVDLKGVKGDGKGLGRDSVTHDFTISGVKVKGVGKIGGDATGRDVTISGVDIKGGKGLKGDIDLSGVGKGLGDISDRDISIGGVDIKGGKGLRGEVDLSGVRKGLKDVGDRDISIGGVDVKGGKGLKGDLSLGDVSDRDVTISGVDIKGGKGLRGEVDLSGVGKGLKEIGDRDITIGGVDVKGGKGLKGDLSLGKGLGEGADRDLTLGGVDIKGGKGLRGEVDLSGVGKGLGEAADRDITISGMELKGLGKGKDSLGRDVTLSGVNVKGVGKVEVRGLGEGADRDLTLGGVDIQGGEGLGDASVRDVTIGGVEVKGGNIDVKLRDKDSKSSRSKLAALFGSSKKSDESTHEDDKSSPAKPEGKTSLFGSGKKHDDDKKRSLFGGSSFSKGDKKSKKGDGDEKSGKKSKTSLFGGRKTFEVADESEDPRKEKAKLFSFKGGNRSPSPETPPSTSPQATKSKLFSSFKKDGGPPSPAEAPPSPSKSPPGTKTKLFASFKKDGPPSPAEAPVSPSKSPPSTKTKLFSFKKDGPPTPPEAPPSPNKSPTTKTKLFSFKKDGHHDSSPNKSPTGPTKSKLSGLFSSSKSGKKPVETSLDFIQNEADVEKMQTEVKKGPKIIKTTTKSSVVQDIGGNLTQNIEEQIEDVNTGDVTVNTQINTAKSSDDSNPYVSATAVTTRTATTTEHLESNAKTSQVEEKTVARTTTHSGTRQEQRVVTQEVRATSTVVSADPQKGERRGSLSSTSSDDSGTPIDAEGGVYYTDYKEPIVETESVILESPEGSTTRTLVTTTEVPLVSTSPLLVSSGDPAYTLSGEIVSTQTITSKTRTVETVTYKTEKDGVVETRVEQKITIQSDGDPIDHDKALAEAIQEATAMNPDMQVEKIEIQQESLPKDEN